VRASAEGSASFRGADNGWAADMGIILKFPDDGRTARLGRTAGGEESATVIILPVIRIERYETRIDDAKPYAPPPAQKGKRRRLRRR
jgi:hypothetical protein